MGCLARRFLAAVGACALALARRRHHDASAAAGEREGSPRAETALGRLGLHPLDGVAQLVLHRLSGPLTLNVRLLQSLLEAVCFVEGHHELFFGLGDDRIFLLKLCLQEHQLTLRFELRLLEGLLHLPPLLTYLSDLLLQFLLLLAAELRPALRGELNSFKFSGAHLGRPWRRRDFARDQVPCRL